MKSRVASIAMLTAMMVGLSFVHGDTSAQTPPDGPEATISALQTQIASLTTATAVPGAAAASPTAGKLPSGISGTALKHIKKGKPGELSIVAKGSYAKGQVPVIVRNNTQDSVAYVQVSGEVRGADGKVAQLVNAGQFYPQIVAPGQLAIGWVSFEQPVNDGDKVKLKVKSSGNVSFWESQGYIPLEVTELNLLDDGRVTGSLQNPSDKTTTQRGYTILMCFDDAWTPVYEKPGSVDEGIAPGDVAAFEFGQFGGLPVGCGNYLVGAYSSTG